MKKISIFLLAAFSLFAITSCEDDSGVTESLKFVAFDSKAKTVSVELNGTGSTNLKVYTTSVAGSDRTFTVTVDDASTADASSYTVPTTVTIPSGTNVGDLSLSFTDTNISNSGETLILSLSGDDYFVGENVTLNLVRNCPSDLAGTYMAVSNGTSTDGAPVNNPLVDFSYQVVITQTGTTTYTISDGFAGVYQDWYCDAYGYCFETEGNFSDTCGELSGEWVDGFDSDVTLTGTDNFDGTLTITWSNGFDDTATAVYTKQ